MFLRLYDLNFILKQLLTVIFVFFFVVNTSLFVVFVFYGLIDSVFHMFLCACILFKFI